LISLTKIEHQVAKTRIQFFSSSGHAFLVGHFTKNIVQSMLLSTRCRKCKKHTNDNACINNNCSKTWSGSSKGMESQAAVDGVSNIYDNNNATV
jgi:hypothetical protein